jgi:hypothetical protein
MAIRTDARIAVFSGTRPLIKKNIRTIPSEVISTTGNRATDKYWGKSIPGRRKSFIKTPDSHITVTPGWITVYVAE